MVHVRMLIPFGSRSGGPPNLPPPPDSSSGKKGAVRVVPEFRAIELDGIGTVQFTQGAEYTVSYDDVPSGGFNITIGEPHDAPFGATVKDGVLHLESGFGGGKFVIRSNPPGFRVTGPHLERITIKGAAKAKILTLRDERLAVSVDGAGDIQLSELDLGRLQVRIGGAGKLNASGRASEQEIDITGAGSFVGENLTGATGRVSINGAGKAMINVSDHLSVSIGGVGQVVYLGNPGVEQRVGGLGRVRRA